jgi:tetratricopeptide (TPR) repeat protein
LLKADQALAAKHGKAYPRRASLLLFAVPALQLAGRLERARRSAKEAFHAARTAKDREMLPRAAIIWASVEHESGDYQAARELIDLALETSELASGYTRATVLKDAAYLALKLGDSLRGIYLVEEAVRTYRYAQYMWPTGNGPRQYSRVVMQLAFQFLDYDPKASAMLWREALTVRRRFHGEDNSFVRALESYVDLLESDTEPTEQAVSEMVSKFTEALAELSEVMGINLLEFARDLAPGVFDRNQLPAMLASKTTSSPLPQ